MTVVRKRAGEVPADDTNLPLWADVFPLLIEPNKLLIADDLKGADVAFDNSVPIWNETGGAVAWTGAQHTRKADGTARTSTAGRRTGIINVGIADMRVMLVITHATLNGDDPGLIFRYVDDNNYWFFGFDIVNNIYRLQKRVAGVGSVVQNAGAKIDGAVHEVRCEGNDITCYVNGILYASATSADLNTATRAGFHESQAASPARFTNFQAGSL